MIQRIMGKCYLSPSVWQRWFGDFIWSEPSRAVSLLNAFNSCWLECKPSVKVFYVAFKSTGLQLSHSKKEQTLTLLSKIVFPTQTNWKLSLSVSLSLYTRIDMCRHTVYIRTVNIYGLSLWPGKEGCDTSVCVSGCIQWIIQPQGHLALEKGNAKPF